MPYTLIIREEANEEMKNAFLYYEHAQPGLGERFLFELEKRFNEIQEHPQFYGFIDFLQKMRDAKVKHFPYQIIYEIIENSVVVFSVFNSYQDPSKLKIK
jgi:hypothetical protein